MHNADHWLAKLARLRIDTASGAPHKPLLLLVVLDLAQQGSLLHVASGQPQREDGGDVLPLTPQLAFAFARIGRSWLTAASKSPTSSGPLPS